MKANLADLNNVLFEQIERINDDTLQGADLDNTLKKAKAISGISLAIAKNVDLALRAAAFDERTGGSAIMPKETVQLLGLEAR